MALYDVNDKLQNDVGKKDYWKLFDSFRRTALHSAFIAAISDFLSKNNSINSSRAGSQIITKLQTENVSIFNNIDSSVIGGLFGMTLWNHMANTPDLWYFRILPKEEGKDTAGTFYFKRNR